ncbi:MAG: 4-hydroxy-3-methylbut-2-enyl diphosphate reductase, partial [Oscillospiraceae bacterium]|nr:4-hydroxy-3-methylbut-2-enyl diphosphate reductase [Oscillospiraceae bacterium]
MTNKKSNKIEIITAENCGFCFGVRKAVNMLFDEMKLSGSGDRKNRIYLFGKIIHNNLFIDELTSKGLIIIDDKDIEEIYGQIKLKNYDFLKQKFDFNNNRSVTVVIRAHGIPKIIFDALKELEISENNMKVIDATCECVKRNHKTAAENTSAETFAVIFGDKNHPEIVGLESYVNGEVRIFKDLEKLEENFDSLKQEISKKNYKKLIILAQTTHNIDDYKKSRDFIEKNFNDKNDENCTDADAVFINSMNFFDTICGATQKRQAEAEKLSKICDVMIVVGGQNSSNTKKLYEICKKNCVNSFIVETSERLPLNIFDLGQAVVKVGITAGASTPDSIIEEVKKIMADSTENSKNINEEAIGSENDQHEQSFAELLDLTFATLNRGDRVKGIVSYVSAGEVHVDLNGKYTGVLAFDEVTDDSAVDLKDMFKVGDEIETQIIKINDLDGTALLSKKRIDSNDNWDKIIKSFENGTICEGKIVQVVNGGIIVLIDGVKVFVPASHANVSKDTDLQTLVGNKVKVKIIDVNQQKRRAIAS